MTAPRPIGDYYASGQDAWTCEDCSQEWYACTCDGGCDDPLHISDAEWVRVKGRADAVSKFISARKARPNAVIV